VGRGLRPVLVPVAARATHAFRVQVLGAAVDVDVVPYGEGERPDRSVVFPDDHKLNVVGVREAFDAAQAVRSRRSGEGPLRGPSRRSGADWNCWAR
jgi:predicted nucleotidyltransferase